MQIKLAYKNYSRRTFFLFIILCIGISRPTLSAENVLQVRYAKSQVVNSLYKRQTEYFYEIFLLALEKSQVPYQLNTIKIPTNVEQSRSIKLLESGYYDAHWYTTDARRERLMKPIRIPLTKGLIGMRLMFIHQDNPDLLKGVTQAKQLKSFVGGQGRNWPDSILLKQHGFHIEEATNSVTLLRILNAKRIDYFPRSMLEIWHENTVLGDKKIMVDQHIALQYPLAIYFFVAKKNEKLYNALELGLNRAISDGAFDQIFFQYYSDYIEKSQLQQRNIIQITNPNLSAETPLERTELWYPINQLNVKGALSSE